MAPRSRSNTGRTKRSSKRSGPLIGAQSPAEQQEALAARLSRERMEAFLAALTVTEGALQDTLSRRTSAVHEIMRESYDLLDSLLGELDLDPPIACKRGCIHCCYNQIALTEPEALYLGRYLLGTRTPEQLEDITDRTGKLVSDLSGKSWQDIGMARHRLPCLFMENGNCSVYPARPFACRGWNSVNVNHCIQSNMTEDALTPIENHPIMRLLAESLQKGLLRGASALGLEAGYLLMSRAVSLIMDGDPEKGLATCTTEWLGGLPFFGRKTDW